ncbi:MAG: pimeloyl-CoA dehydrogenase large subunit [Rhodospirillaceae bacterium]|jgi:alkylation response protein AidB-like acyl-CoA dehydrogenase|nr:pimeloyl-CoA dehydrogenase large subunit [Rhodospirillaceae bacterium]
MDAAFSAKDDEFRQDVRAFLRDATPPKLKYKVDNGIEMQREDVLSWHRILYKQGWVAPNWPEEHGGPGWTLNQKYIFDEELGLAGAPRLITFGINMCGPVLIGFGTEAQKKQFLPPMLSSEHVWCQGYSEPNAGSDLASLRTTAVRDGDEWVINGSKMWTTKAHWADWCFLLARTSDAGRKQEGITFILVDLKTPGIEIKPIILMDGLHETNQVFYTDVRVPVENTIGEIDKGWSIGKFLLAHERMSGGSLGTHKTLLRQLKAIAATDEQSGGRPLTEDPTFARHIAEIDIGLRTLEAFNLRAIDKFSQNGELGSHALGVEANIFKIRNTEFHQRLTELKLKAIGYYGMPYILSALSHGWNEPPIGAEYANGCAPAYLHFRKVTIYSGSNEIQHNIIAKARLGL